MPAAFTTQYAAQLAEFTEIRVKEAEANESLQPGTLYICPGGQHLRVTPTGRIQLDGASGRISGYLPNIDVTMESVAAFAGPLSIAGVLTAWATMEPLERWPSRTRAAWCWPRMKQPP